MKQVLDVVVLMVFLYLCLEHIFCCQYVIKIWIREREKIVIIFIGNVVQRLFLVSVFLIANVVFRFTVISE